MKSKIKIALILVTSIITLSVIYIYFFSNTLEINEIIEFNNKEITKIAIKDGRSGNVITIEDKEIIQEFLEQIDYYKLKEYTATDESTGYIYAAIFYNESTKLFDIVFVDPLKINGKYYKILKSKISTSTIEKIILKANE